MKTLKIIFSIFTLIVSFTLFPQIIFGQTETFDMVKFIPPKNWTKTEKKGAVVYSDLNKAANAFCVITVYSGTASNGSAAKDFAADWKTFVVEPYKAEAKPKTDSQTEDGWTTTSATALIETDGIKSLAMLAVFSGFGKTTSILTISNHEKYIKPISAFLESIKLDQTPLPTIIAAAVPVNNSSIVGRWGDTTGSGAIGYGTNASQKQYTFNADGTYSFDYAGWSGTVGYSGSFHIQRHETGVYTLDGDSVTITPKKNQITSNSKVTQKPLETVTYRWTVHYFEGSQYYALILHPDHKTERDGSFDYVLAFPDSYSYSKAK